MKTLLSIHPETPQPRRITQAADIIRQGGVIAWPTDSSYALGCHLGDKAAMERIQRIRQFDGKHHYTLVCADLSDIATYAKVDNSRYRMLKHLTPGPFTFILQATREVPRRLQNPKRKTIGLRVPDHAIAHALLAELGEPLLSATLILPGHDYPLSDPWDIQETLSHDVDLVIDGGYCGLEPTSVVDLTDDEPQILRVGKGDVSLFEA